ncbi:MAG: class I SAM-dependent methyltransferase [Gemmatimonadales bacterium]|nr:class I SAM-dependent methyltransferase [Gemmatimonadales bacterium]
MSVTMIEACRLAGSRDLVDVLDLGEQALTGVFPRSASEPVTRGPLRLCFSPTSGLLQLRHSYDLGEMYGDNYGYRSGLNASMVAHLRAKVAALVARAPLRPGDVVLDIGSNDSTTLQAYPDCGQTLLGIDPTGRKFGHFYPKHIRLVADFFTAATYRQAMGERRARIVTSISMFYDLERPLDFVRDVAAILADDGIWHFEQSYMPTMLERDAYDTVCHEHLEYYALRPVLWMLERAGLELVDVELNDVNGGSFALTAQRKGGPQPVQHEAIAALLERERAMGIDTLAPYEAFRARVQAHRDELVRTVRGLTAAGRTVLGYGASTKGNVLLQYCGFTPADIPCIAEVNPDKFGRLTPGTHIPIVSEAEARARRPDYFLVLPWHFRTHLVERERDFLAEGGRMLFPLPRIEVVG